MVLQKKTLTLLVRWMRCQDEEVSSARCKKCLIMGMAVKGVFIVDRVVQEQCGGGTNLKRGGVVCTGKER